MKSLKPCIITFFDLIGIKYIADTGKASQIMFQMNRFAANYMNHNLSLQYHAYIWNDSVLLVSFHVENKKRIELLKQLDDFFQKLHSETRMNLFSIMVMGQAFVDTADEFANLPTSLVFQGQITDQPRAIQLKTSSWAMANCYYIESVMREKKKKATWYIDSRIDENLTIGKKIESVDVKMLPSNEVREVNLYNTLSL